MNDKLIKLGVLVPALCAVFGTLIINIGLNSYGLFDHEIFRLHAIYVGATFFTFCLAMTVLFAAFTNVEDPSQDSQGRIILLTVWKIVFASLALYYIVDRDYAITDCGNWVPFQAFFFSTWGGQGFFLLYLFYMADRIREGEAGRKEKGFFYLLLAVSTIVSIVQFLILYCEKSGFQGIAHLIGMMGLFYYCGVEGRIPIIQKRKADPCYRPKSLFGRFMSPETAKLEITMASLFFLLAIMLLLSSYSTNLYTKIPKSWGGMKAQEMTITYSEGKVLNGRILHASTSALYVGVQSDDEIVVLQKAEITGIGSVSQ